MSAKVGDEAEGGGATGDEIKLRVGAVDGAKGGGDAAVNGNAEERKGAAHKGDGGNEMAGGPTPTSSAKERRGSTDSASGHHRTHSMRAELFAAEDRDYSLDTRTALWLCERLTDTAFEVVDNTIRSTKTRQI